MQKMIMAIALSGAGAGIVIFALRKIIPKEKMRAWGYTHGRLISNLGGAKLGKVFYEPLESFFQNWLGEYFLGLNEGLDSDDSTVKKDEKKS